MEITLKRHTTITFAYMKTPRKLTLEMMFRRIMEQNPSMLDNIRYNTDFAVVNDCGEVLRIFIDSSHAPFLMEDYRMGFVHSGHMRTVINLQECLVQQGDILAITPGTVVEPLEMSADFSVTGLGVSAECFRMIHNDNLPASFHGQRKHRSLHLTDRELELLTDIFRCLWSMTGSPAVSVDTQESMIAAVSNTFNDLFILHDTADYPQGKPHDTAYNMFQRFITLVNDNCREHRQLDYYAGCLCVTRRHLGTTVAQVSGTTAKEWIDKAVITAAKVMLRHTDNTVQQIADDLHFPTASFFCKYFHRLTGCTPQRWREGEG